MKYLVRDVRRFGFSNMVHREFKKKRAYKTVWVPSLWESWWKIWHIAKTEHDINRVTACLICNKQELLLDDVYLREAADFEEAIYGDIDQTVGGVSYLY